MNRVNKDDMLYDAWCVIANAGFAPLNWRIDGKTDHLTQEEREWVEAAERWRDAWHATFPPHQRVGHDECICGTRYWRIALRKVRVGWEWCVVEHRSHTMENPHKQWCSDASWMWHWAPTERWARRRYQRTLTAWRRNNELFAAQLRAIEDAT